MLNDLILVILKHKIPYVNQFKQHLIINVNFYYLFLLFIFRKNYINSLFI